MTFVLFIFCLVGFIACLPKWRDEQKVADMELANYVSAHERERAYHNECIEKAASGDASAIAYFQLTSGLSREEIISRAQRAMLNTN